VAPCMKALDSMGIPYEVRILSAHRTPEALREYVEGLEEKGTQVVVAAAGMAAHLAGVVAAHTSLPVIGVPLASGALQGVDALLSTAQMPGGVPVACMGIGGAGAKNAAFFAARLLSLHDVEIREALSRVTAQNKEKVLAASFSMSPTGQPEARA
jgi:phosphoribosylaminoimidazole carboxylase PurE protein